jgi:hypothetical protein
MGDRLANWRVMQTYSQTPKREPRSFSPGDYESLDTRIVDSGELKLWLVRDSLPNASLRPRSSATSRFALLGRLDLAPGSISTA